MLSEVDKNKAVAAHKGAIRKILEEWACGRSTETLEDSFLKHVMSVEEKHSAKPS